ncbi:MAG: ATP-binding cassette domain-containing protein, partial [Caulobacteraceae bacterium]
MGSMSDTPPVLKIAALKKSVPGGRVLFENLNLELQAGEFVAIMGESGVGKSTFLNLIAGLDQADAGAIAIDGVDLAGLNDDARTLLRRDRIGFVFQAFHILPHLTLGQNVALPLVLQQAPGEEALTKEKADGATLIKALGGAMPNTLSAQIALAEAYVGSGQTERAARIARAIWTENFLDKATEAKVLSRLGSLLDRDAHWARAMHLMMHDRATGVERLMQYMTPAQKSLALARNAVSRNTKNAKKLLDAVDPSMRTNSVYQFSRAQRARQFELWDDAINWLDKAKGEPVDAAEFWYERRTLARQLLA